MFKNIIDKAKDAASKATKAASDSLSTAKSKSEEKAEEYWPRIEATILEKTLPLVEDNLENEENLIAFLEKAYHVLPAVIRVALSRGKFIEFCILKKEPLLEKIKKYKSEKERSQNGDLLLEENINELKEIDDK